MDLKYVHRAARGALAATLGLLGALAAHATLASDEIPGAAGDGPITLYYPSQAPEQAVRRGKFSLQLAVGGAPAPGNGRLVVISHGSGGAPWVHADLARALVRAGFVVAMPEHHADNYKDDSDPGPDSWTRRPAEVSRAIDTVARDPRFAAWLKVDKVGVYGISAGGHTALSLAGGQWSPGGFKRHCEAHLDEDFAACVGLITRLHGDWLDGLRRWGALTVIRYRFDDDRPRIDTDPRIAAAVAGVPFAADFDMDTLIAPRVPLGLITAGQDRWLAPRFHSARVLQACRGCEHLAELPGAGHGALLSPSPPGLTGLVGELLNDPPGFDRSQTAEVDRRVADFFSRHLLP